MTIDFKGAHYPKAVDRRKGPGQEATNSRFLADG